jgi:hypothetical protein
MTSVQMEDCSNLDGGMPSEGRQVVGMTPDFISGSSLLRRFVCAKNNIIVI